MTSRATQNFYAGRMWPVGRRLESPDVDHAVPKESVWKIFFNHTPFPRIVLPTSQRLLSDSFSSFEVNVLHFILATKQTAHADCSKTHFDLSCSPRVHSINIVPG